MIRKRRFAGVGLFAAAAMLLRSAESACAQDYYNNRGYQNSCGRSPSRGSFFGYRPGLGWGCHDERRETAGPQLRRYVDATGRWTGDGIDTMATNPPPWKR